MNNCIKAQLCWEKEVCNQFEYEDKQVRNNLRTNRYAKNIEKKKRKKKENSGVLFLSTLLRRALVTKIDKIK